KHRAMENEENDFPRTDKKSTTLNDVRVANRGPIAVLRASQHDCWRVPPRASLLLRKFYCGDRPVALMASDRNSETVEFIEPKPVPRSSLSVSQKHGFANKLGLSPFEFDKDRAGSRFSGWHGGRLVG